MPAGLIDEGEDAAQAAVRELKEETGLQQTASSNVPASCIPLNDDPCAVDQTCFLLLEQAASIVL